MLTVKDSATKTATVYCDDKGTELHTAQVVYKSSARIVIFPFSYSAARGVQRKKLAEIEYKGWATVASIPKAIRPSARFAITDKRAKQILRALTDRLPSLNKIVFVKTGTTKIATPMATFASADFDRLVRTVNKEIQLYDTRRKTVVKNALAGLSSSFTPVTLELAKGAGCARSKGCRHPHIRPIERHLTVPSRHAATSGSLVRGPASRDQRDPRPYTGGEAS